MIETAAGHTRTWPSKMRPTNRSSRDMAGRLAERVTEWMFRLKGFRLLERRFRCPLGEIDLILKRGDLILFVEVKYRKNMATLDHAMSGRQQVRISRAAAWYLQGHPSLQTASCRFDLVLLSARCWPRFLPNAWQA